MLETQDENRPSLSVVTPAYNEEDNLPLLYERLCQVLDARVSDWEWIVVDDHSSDSTFGVVSSLTNHDPRVRGLRFSRNFGSHTALTCGLHQARGECAVIMAADLQDPPEVLPILLDEWKGGSHVVWAVRGQREGEKVSTVAFSRLFYLLMRQVVGLRAMPSTGADFFLIDRKVIEAFCQFAESNVGIAPLIAWMGFRQSSITYDKQARLHGSSGWNLEKKLKMTIDSVMAFTYLPIRLMSYLGIIVSLVGFVYAGIVIIHSLAGTPVPGYPSIIVAILMLGGVQMLMTGVLGEYLWRTLDETRRRPRYIIEATTDQPR